MFFFISMIVTSCILFVRFLRVGIGIEFGIDGADYGRLRRTYVAIAVWFRFPELLWGGEPCRVPKWIFWYGTERGV